MSKISLKEQDLVLKVNKNVDTDKWDESKYYEFIQQLTNGRKYQEEAILAALRFMCGGQYNNTKELAEENFRNNSHIQEKFTTQQNFLKSLYFSDRYTANIDLATGTGKSWVLYGIARIMLEENLVDQVLVLVPSLTIETELTNKFKMFSTNTDLNNTLKNAPPKIINGTESIVKGTICIENRDAIYNNTRSSIIDSLTNKGDRTLVLSDEAHHIYYSEKNKWKDFIEKINFKYNIGVSGTCYYSDNDYFSDVIYRYSLKTAIEEQKVKSVEYIAEDNVPNKKDERWQVIINSHNDIKRKLEILPITIVILDKTTTCDNRANEFKEYLKKSQNLTDEEIKEKVLVIHSNSSTAGDRLRLRNVDDSNSKVEWIFSVSMLTEGWDVKRVFQIVPDEQRAFNSKLLIAQVLGRGLRIPKNWDYSTFSQPKVIVFNHAKWASGVETLVNEVLEIEKRISTKIIEQSPSHLELLNVDYKKRTKTTKSTMNGKTYKLFEKGYIELPTDSENEKIEVNFKDIKNNQRDWKTNVKHKTFTVDQMALKMWDRFTDVPDDNNEGLAEKYQDLYPIEKLKEVIEESLRRSGNTVITEKLSNRFMSALGTLWRQGNSYVDYNVKPDNYSLVDSKTNMRSESTSASLLKNNHTLFWTDDTIKYLTDEEKVFFDDIIDTGAGYKQVKIDNKNLLKTPTSLVIATSEPERKFISKLIKKENADMIDCWIKSPSTGFYSLEYAWKKNPRHGEAIRYDKFNPDFFIKVKNKMIVVEIKDDSEIQDPSPENIGKYRSAVEHFQVINNYLKTNTQDNGIESYHFTMLTPKNYEIFFECIKNGNIDNFNSELNVAIDLKQKDA
ncbi:MAG: DEAD/DEAH box helicase family protein [Clostridia bacterium]|nr:DEAD/DEAH box helicase family protein [Clostridia bacterium]